MHQVILSATDLTRITISESDTTHIESIFALEALGESSGEEFRMWRRRVWLSAPGTDPGKTEVAKILHIPGGPERLLEICTDAEIPPPAACSAALKFLRTAVAPHRARLQAHLDAARETLRGIMARDGVEVLLNSLGPGISWNAPVLSISGVRPGESRPGGGGLVLTPSLFLQHTGKVIPAGGRGAGGAALLAFADRPGPDDVARILGEHRANDPHCALAALVGRTRAATLHAVKEGCTNTELAERLGVSTAAVSQHTAVLRSAGLIRTRRNRSRMIHTVTPLGRLLLQGEAAQRHPAPAPRPSTAQSRQAVRAVGVVGMSPMLP
ncbi:winged helix-turn-helix transcriptional regulator [Streptomyces sp. LBUM 1476]|nr:winged helix-turn-helix transcriptional regulator [Streptomyces sp. LBUM 1476]GAQ51534.1 MarR family protein [Streptomyces acidiscabies]GAV38539.1 MarR family protein [Streptomyces acidiscabies]